MKSHLRGNLLVLLFTVVICCVLYPTMMYALGRGVFPTGGTGSLINEKGEDAKDDAKGSRLIAQPFTGDEYFWPRPSAASYNATAAGGSNWGANNPKLRDRVAQQLGPMVVYKAGSKSAGPDLANPRTPQNDIEVWFATVTDRVATWASDSSMAPAAWAKIDLANDKYGLQGEYILAWAKDHSDVTEEWKKANLDKTDDPKPEDLVVQFFASFAKVHPSKWPGVTKEKKIEAVEVVDRNGNSVANDALLQANFFDLWLSDSVNASKVADLEPVVADMVMASGSGLDPHITLRNALSVYQLDRVAKKRGAPREKVVELVKSKSFTPLSGLIGEPLVNVLEVNIELNKQFPIPATP